MTATILKFPEPSLANRFSTADRSAIIAAAMAISPRWGASFSHDVDGDVATIGRAAGGDERWDVSDAFGVVMVRDGVELLDFADMTASTHRSIRDALAVMKSLAVL